MHNRKTVIFALTTAVIWGISFVATKVAVNTVPPSTLGLIRFIIAYISLSIISSVMKRKEKISRADRVTVILMGLTGVTLYFVFENLGLKFTSAANGSLIVSTVPVFTLIFNALFLREKISGTAIAGIIISFIGIYILLFGFSFNVHLNYRGDIIMFLSVFSWVAYTYFMKKERGNYSIITVTKELSFWGGLFFIPIVIYEIWKEPLFFRAVNSETIISILYLGVICSALAYLLWNKALEQGDSKFVNSFIYLIPLFSIITESFYFRRLPAFNVYIAAALIISGLFITGLKPSSLSRLRRQAGH